MFDVPPQIKGERDLTNQYGMIDQQQQRNTIR